MCECESFERESFKHTFLRVLIDFLLEVVT